MQKVEQISILEKGRVAPDDDTVVGTDANGEPAGEIARITIIVKDESWDKFAIESTAQNIPQDVLPTFFRKVAKTVEGSILGAPL